MKKNCVKKVLVCFITAVLLLSNIFLNSIPVNALDSNYFGVCDHCQFNSDYVNHLDQIIASGVKWLRIDTSWGNIETSRGVYSSTYLTKLDYIVNTCYTNGVNLDLILCYTAPWASTNPSDPAAMFYKPANWADWENFVTFITNRYNGKVKTWEVWNEEDATGFWKNSVDDYNTLLQKAYARIKAADSTNQVLLGGLACPDGNTTWFDSLISKGAASYFDVMNYHSYGYAVGNTAVMDKLYNSIMAVVNKYPDQMGSKRIWITETGFSSSGDSTMEIGKSDALDAIYTLNKCYSNVDRIFYYSYRNTNTGNLSEDNFGLVKRDLTPLKALSYYQSTNGAASDFITQEDYPTLALTNLALVYYKMGDGSGITYSNGNMTIPSNRYMYMRINDNWLYDTNTGLDTSACIDVTYLDMGTTQWAVQYDAQSNSYMAVQSNLTNTGTWKTKTFTLNDIKFANRQNWSSDFRLYSINGPLTVQKIVVRKVGNRAINILGTTDRYTLLPRLDCNNPGDERYNPATTIGGKECRQITKNTKYIYFAVAKGLMKAGDPNARLGITYWDAGTDYILIQYSAIGNIYKPLYITKTNTNTWKYKEFTITDANFAGLQNFYGDFRIGSWGDANNAPEYISKVELYKQ